MTSLSHCLLSLLIWVPILGGFVTLVTNSTDKDSTPAKWVALAFSIVTLILCVPLYLLFDPSISGMQLTEMRRWFSLFDGTLVYYGLGVDGFSVLFIILTAFSTLVVLLAAWNTITYKTRQYMAIFLISCGLMNGIFSATNTILFYVFWEALLIPTVLGIGIWGGKQRAYAAVKFFMYTFLGSVFLLAAFFYLHVQVASQSVSQLISTDTFSIGNFIHWATQNNAANITLTAQWLLLGAFFLAFAIKIPMWPFHSWLPDAHSEAPDGGSVILAALMLKLGAYGFLRFVLPIVPSVTAVLDWLLIASSLIAIIYVGIIAMAQTNIKRLIAYSSISHMGLVTLALFSIFVLVRHDSYGQADAFMAVQGAMFQMIAHAFSSGGLFIAAGMLAIRMGSQRIKDFQGVATSMPILATFVMLFALANVGLPGTSGFVGEFLIILSVFKYAPWVALLAGLTLVIAPGYTLWLYKRVFFGKVVSQKVSALQDISGMEIFVLTLLAVPVIFFGLFPQTILSVSHAASHAVVSGAAGA